MQLFGRAEHLAVADQALANACAGRGGVLIVSGEAGIGKSALARTLATEAEARGVRVGFGRAWEVGGAPAYWPWSQALSDLGLDLDELLGSTSGQLASAQRVVAFDRIVRAVCPADQAPVALILDDVHAADVATLELALAFARAALRKRALLVVTTRESELLEKHELGELVGRLSREGSALPLRRLDAADTASWLSNVGFDGDASEVHRICEGNPLFIEEAVRLGIDRFATAAAGGVAVVLAEHLKRISEKTREILAVAAVLGREASYTEVAALADASVDDVEAAAREGLQAGVLSPVRAAVAFSHVLLRDSLYETLGSSRRASLHVRAADQIEAKSGPPGLVAEHLLAAGPAVDPKRVAYTVRDAAEAAAKRHAGDSAIEMITSARARLAGRIDEDAALVLDLAEVDAIMCTRPSDQTRARAADCAARAKRRGLGAEYARAALSYGRELLSLQLDRTMIDLLEEALVLVPAEERSLRAQVLARLAAAISPPKSQEELKRSVRYAREALAIARALGHAPTLLSTLFWCHHGILYGIPYDERVELTSELVSLAREHGADFALITTHNLHAASLRESGRPVAARHEAEAYIRYIESLPLPNVHWRADVLRATMAAFDGRLDEARALIDEFGRTSAGIPQRVFAWANFELAFCAGTRDIERLRRIEDAVTSPFAGRPVLEPFVALIEAMLGKKEPALERLRRIPPERGLQGLGLFIRAEATVYLQDAELADQLYDHLLNTAPHAEEDAQPARVRSAGRMMWGTSTVFPFGPVERLLGELALLRRDIDRAREHFKTALADCLDMEAVPFIPLCKEALVRVGHAPRPTPPPQVPRASVQIAREGDVWVVTSSASAPFRVKHAKGMEYLDHLLRSPNRETYVLVLGGAGEGPEDAGAILDERAKAAYARRVEELEDQLDEAERLGDQGRATRAREELEAVAEQLASAVGLGGRDRKAASNVHRARVNVQRRLKDAIRRIGEHDPALGVYLESTVKTGTYCVYRPI